MPITLDGTTGITTPGLTNTGTETVVNLTTTGNTTLGDASTDTLNVGNGGLVKDASGNVGIGTASPASKLDVLRSSTTTATFDESLIRLINSGAATLNQRVDIGMRWQDGTYNGIGGISMIRESATARSGALSFSSIGSDGNPTNAMRITSAGYVGINTSSPETNGAFCIRKGVTTSAMTNCSFSTSDAANSTFDVGHPSANLVALSAQGSSLALWAGSAERARFNSTGALVFAGGTTTADGIGITFPATQSASSNANTLDDYEEGTFSTSMNLKFGGANVGMVYGDRKAQYVKIGKMVLVNLYIYLTAKGSSTGQASIEGFPFGTNTLVDFFIPLGVRGNLNSSGNQVSLYSASAGATTFMMYQCNLTGGANAQLSDTAFNNNTELNFNFWYYTNS